MVKPSFTCTVYQFSCGAYDSVTGIPAMQYSPGTARVFVGPKGSAIRLLGVGYFPVTDAEGITSYDLNEGDIIHVEFQTGSEGYWRVMARREIPVGNVLAGYVLNLSRLLNLPFIDTGEGGVTTSYAGFETITTDPTTGAVTEGYDDSFERIIIVT